MFHYRIVKADFGQRLILPEKILIIRKINQFFQVVDIGDASMTIKVTLNPGHGMNYHSHELRDEVWTVIDGKGRTIVDGQTRQVGPGDVIRMPPSGLAATTRSLRPMHSTGTFSSFTTCTFSHFSLSMALPILLLSIASVSVFHVPMSFHMPANRMDPYVEEDYFRALQVLGGRAAVSGANLVLMGIEPTYPSAKSQLVMDGGNLRFRGGDRHLGLAVHGHNLTYGQQCFRI